MTEQTALVVALLGDSVIEIRQCDLYRIGVELPIAGAPPQTLVEPGRIHTTCYHHGDVTVHVTPVEPVRPLARGFDMDPRWASYLGLSLALHLVLWAFVAVVPADDLGIGVRDTIGPTVVIARGVLDGDPHAGGGGRNGDGGDDSELAAAGVSLALASPSPAAQVSRITREQAIAAALTNAMVDHRTITAIDALVGSAEIEDVAGSTLYTSSAGTGFGTAVFGGAGSGFGTITSGAYDTLVAGSGAGTGWGLPGRGVGHPFAREARAPTVVMCGRPGCAYAIGDQDKAIIRRYLRRALPKIRYCYEKELLARPELIGDISTEFLIAPDGHVTSSHAEGFDDTVASCVADVIGNIQFPRAGRGGNTQVHYPFVFRPTG